jgi:hypothetical protein
MSAPYVSPLLQRTLAVVYRFYDVFFFPLDDSTPPITSPLDVSIPSLQWSAFAADDFTYRFSALTLTRPAPAAATHEVQVTALQGDYVSFESIKVPTILISSPPQVSDFLRNKPLWPTAAVHPPLGETAIRGQIRSTTAKPVDGLKVEIWDAASPTPPPGTPYTLTDANGGFLYRFPLLKGAAGSALALNIQLNGGAIGLTSTSFSIALGATQILIFQRT